MITYTGRIVSKDDIFDYDRIVILNNGEVIDPKVSLKIVNHSPTGFCWGYGGSGPAQLALAILLVHLNGDKQRALTLYQDFKLMVIARLPMGEDFELTGTQVDFAISQIERRLCNEYVLDR
jgi:hypothetical protein